MSNYNPYENPYSNPYGQPAQPPVQKSIRDGDNKKWSWRDWLAKVIIPILVALIGTGAFFGVKSATNTQPSLPQLRNSYIGTMIRTFDGATFDFKLTQLNENQSGAFTASATINGCPANVSGSTTSSGDINFTAQESNLCQDGGLTADFTGTINADGSLGGNWSIRSENLDGTWRVQ